MTQFFLVQNEHHLNPYFPESQIIPLEGLVIEQKYDDGKRRAIKLVARQEYVLADVLEGTFYVSTRGITGSMRREEFNFFYDGDRITLGGGCHYKIIKKP